MSEKLSQNRSSLIVRQGEAADLPGILSLVLELAEYEKASDNVIVNLEKYRAAFSEGYFESLVAETAGEIVGIALYYKAFSTWRGKMMYLEDFVVRESLRGQGIGKLLFEAFLEAAKAAGVTMCKWQVLDWNSPAINFYRKYETTFDSEWIDVKLYFE